MFLLSVSRYEASDSTGRVLNFPGTQTSKNFRNELLYRLNMCTYVIFKGVHEVKKLPPKVEPMRCRYSSLPSPANYDFNPPSLQKNAISAYMDYGQRIGKEPKLDCQAVCFWSENPT